MCLLEQAAEVQFVGEAEFPCDLLDRLEGVKQLPLGVDQNAVSDEVGRRGPQVLGDILPMVLARLGVGVVQSEESGE